MNFKKTMTDANYLIESFNKSKKGCTWKNSIQRYEIDLLENITELQDKINNNDYSQRPFYEFIHRDRGKTRLIKAINIKDRVALRNFCDNILIPRVEKYYIYDNGASVLGKGISFTRKRLIKHLRQYYNKYGSNGYILLIDFSKFFDNINHEKLIQYLQKIIKDLDAITFATEAIKAFKIDVSYLTDEEYKHCYETVFNSLEYIKIPKYLQTKDKYMYKSMGIGSQISQIAGLLYPTTVDNYCKIVKSLKYYGRYMDDIYIIYPDKKYLQKLLSEIQVICSEIGIFINPHKTQIIKLSRGFTFLKIRYHYTNTGKIIKRVDKKIITKNRRKLKKLKYLLGKKKNLYFKDIALSFNSWYGNLKYFNCYKTKKSMEKLYNELFKEYLTSQF